MNGLRFIGQICLCVSAVCALIVLTHLLEIHYGTTMALVGDVAILAIVGCVLLVTNKEE